MSEDRGTGRGLGAVVLGAGAVALLDLGSKVAATRYLDEPVEIAGPISLTVTRNPGIAFGLGSALPAPILLAVTTAVAVLLVWLVATGELEHRFGASLILGGAVANIVDRALDGSVVDVIDIGWWPTFNLADVAIVCGVGLLLLHSLRAAEADDPPGRATPGRETT